MSDLTGVEEFLAALAGDDLAIGREDRRDADQVTIGYTGTSQRLLERSQLFPMDADSSREKHMRRYHRLFSLALSDPLRTTQLSSRASRGPTDA
jgi:hypothetical protein